MSYPPGSFEFAERIMHAKVQEAQREAEAQRLQRQAGAVRARRDHFYCVALAQLGQRLSAWGERLQERYGAEGSTPTPSHAG